MTTRHDYDYATVRLVPCVPREAFVTVGVVLHARTAGYIDARLVADPAWLAEHCRGIDTEIALGFLSAFERVARGGDGSGPVGLLPPSERFHWLTSPRSTAIQTSPIHTGRTTDPMATLDRLFKEHVGDL